ncbi:MAG: hypothetical protein U0840_15725 [Gemmataceae bacterium]
MATNLVGLLALVIYTVADEKYVPYRFEDLHIFYHAGKAWRSRAEPYDVANLLHPLSALPLFGLLTWVPEAWLQHFIVVLNSGGARVLPWLSWCAMRAKGEDAPLTSSGPALGLLGVAVALAQSSRYKVALGQLGILGAVAVVLAFPLTLGRLRAAKDGGAIASPLRPVSWFCIIPWERCGRWRLRFEGETICSAGWCKQVFCATGAG